MATEAAGAVGEATKAVVDLSFKMGECAACIKIDNAWLAGGLGAGILAVAAFYINRRYPAQRAIRNALERHEDGVVDPEVRIIREGSILVALVFHTEHTFLSFMDDFEATRILCRVEEEFREIGYEEELEVTITNLEEVDQKLNHIRYKDYVKGGLHLKMLRDLDRGVHLARMKVLLGVMDEVDPPHVTDIFPKDGFHEDLTDLPFVNFGIVWKYMIESSSAKKQLSTAKPLVKGFNFLKSGNVVKVTVCSRDNKWLLKSQVLPSMKKSSVYNCFIVLLPNGHIKRAYFGCPASVDGRCNHIAATLFGLEEFCRQREK